MKTTTPTYYKTPSVDELSTVPTKCVSNAMHNMGYYARKGIELKLIGGIFGCKFKVDGSIDSVNDSNDSNGVKEPHEAVYLMYGGLTIFDVDRSMRFIARGEATDIYFWLEDEEGKVYDVIPISTLVSAKISGCVMDLKPLHTFEGVSKEELFEIHRLWYREIRGVSAAMERYLAKKHREKNTRRLEDVDDIQSLIAMAMNAKQYL
jgi:hypothetical protein